MNHGRGRVENGRARRPRRFAELIGVIRFIKARMDNAAQLRRVQVVIRHRKLNGPPLECFGLEIPELPTL